MLQAAGRGGKAPCELVLKYLASFPRENWQLLAKTGMLCQYRCQRWREVSAGSNWQVRWGWGEKWGLGERRRAGCCYWEEE